mmetsp:Transcript_57523/g.93087  ORF Transcript_57523/g.93087 Transcript_57523/m.93087 type:complete len:101 (+) Transcript_57523:119-421(+)
MAQLLKMQAHIRGIDQSKKDETAQNLRVMLDNIPTEPDMTQRNDAQDILSAACAAKTVSDVKDKEDKDLGEENAKSRNAETQGCANAKHGGTKDAPAGGC